METLTVRKLITSLKSFDENDYVFLKDNTLYVVPKKYHDVPDREIPQIWEHKGTYFAPDVDVLK